MVNNENNKNNKKAVFVGIAATLYGGCDPHFTGDRSEWQPFTDREVSVGLGISEQKLQPPESLLMSKAQSILKDEWIKCLGWYLPCTGCLLCDSDRPTGKD